MTLSFSNPERTAMIPLEQKLQQLNPKAMSRQIETTIAEAAAKHLSVSATLEWLADMELEARNGRAIGALAIPRCTNWPRQQDNPLQISRQESVRPSWQNSIETSFVQHVNPLAARSPSCFFTNTANSARGKCWSSWLNRLAACTIVLPSWWVAFSQAPAKERFANVHYRKAFLFTISSNRLGQGCSQMKL
jgi:hypothetical protein